MTIDIIEWVSYRTILTTKIFILIQVLVKETDSGFGTLCDWTWSCCQPDEPIEIQVQPISSLPFTWAGTFSLIHHSRKSSARWWLPPLLLSVTHVSGLCTCQESLRCFSHYFKWNIKTVTILITVVNFMKTTKENNLTDQFIVFGG